MRKFYSLAIVAGFLIAAAPGCDGGHEIPVSKDAPKPEQLNRMADFMNKQSKVKIVKKKEKN